MRFRMGRDLFESRSPQFLQRVGSSHPKVKEWTILEKIQGVQDTPKGIAKDADGNEYDIATGQMLKPMTYRTPEDLESEQNAIAGQQAAIQARHDAVMGAVSSGKQMVNEAYAGGKALVNDATEYGAQAINELLIPQKQVIADDEDKLRPR